MGPKHKLLIGLWRSDRRRTLDSCHVYHTLSDQKKRQFANLFGHLELRYARKSVYHTLKGFRYRSDYQVLAEDDSSIVIRIQSEDLKRQIRKAVGPGCDEFLQPKLQHVTFHRDRGREYYWVGLGSYCEWFRKQSRPRQGMKTRGRRTRNKMPQAI